MRSVLLAVGLILAVSGLVLAAVAVGMWSLPAGVLVGGVEAAAVGGWVLDVGRRWP